MRFTMNVTDRSGSLKPDAKWNPAFTGIVGGKSGGGIRWVHGSLSRESTDVGFNLAPAATLERATLCPTLPGES
ncbi:hypothetical protein BN874_780013 [Candidatus Contendobacter odensis Run_B_J11]|uniref:Uncharacterized protein n=1 Tax=Candidatus Contendobacter odensis Run_B_J11 TaxID=1400861 RepID=A0A7U7GF67_9GAMM|nr:hypothetical protein BN874_780013 [Candidatus Contendobacter odensis Run_B_J11]